MKDAEIVCSVDIYQPQHLRNTYNNALNIMRDLCRCKQAVYRVSERTFFGQASGMFYS